MVGEDEARDIAEGYIRDEIQPHIADELLISGPQDFSTCWVISYDSKIFVETGNVQHALAGNAPLIINKRTGKMRLGSTGLPIEEQLDNY